MSYLYEIYENPFLKTKTNSHTQAKKIAKFGKKKKKQISHTEMGRKVPKFDTFSQKMPS